MIFTYVWFLLVHYVLYGNIDQTLVSSLHGVLNCEIDGFKKAEYKARGTLIMKYSHWSTLFIQECLVNVFRQYLV